MTRFVSAAKIQVFKIHYPDLLVSYWHQYIGIRIDRNSCLVRTCRTGLNPFTCKGDKFLMRDGRRNALCAGGISPRLPRPYDQLFVLKVLDEFFRRHTAASRIKKSPAQFAGRQALPCHAKRRQPPASRSRHTTRRLVGRLMTGAASHCRGAPVVATTTHIECVPVSVIALPRKVDRGVAIHAPRMFQNIRKLDESLARERGLVGRSRLAGHGRAPESNARYHGCSCCPEADDCRTSDHHCSSTRVKHRDHHAPKAGFP
jgi:hypothetical protein